MVMYGDKEIYEDTLEIGNTKKLIKIKKRLEKILEDTTHCNRDTTELEEIIEKIAFVIETNMREE